MKEKIILIILLLCLTSALHSEEVLTHPAFNDFQKNSKSIIVSDFQIKAIYFILSNISEINSHQMRGETSNVVYQNKDGREAVYDKDGSLVTNSYNKGSYNYFNYQEKPIEHFLFDIYPWIIMGNTRDDPTSINERFYYFLLDLDIGIQSFIFANIQEGMDINTQDLSTNTLEVYKFFSYLIFNEKYEIKFSKSTQQNLKIDSVYYYSFFNQIMELGKKIR